MVVVESIDCVTWESDLEKYHYSIFLSPEWINALSDDFHLPVFINFISKGKVIGKIAGFMLNGSKLLQRRQLIFYAGPALLKVDNTNYQSCLNSLRKWAVKNNITRISIGSNDNQHHLPCIAKGFYTNYRRDFVIKLDSKVKCKIKSGFKSNIKKAESVNTLFFECSDNKKVILKRLFELLGITLEKRNTKYGEEYNPFYLRNLNPDSIEKLVASNFGKLYYTKNDDNIYCVALNLERNGKSYSLLIGNHEYAYDNGLSSYVYYNLLQSYQDNHFHYFNLGGVPSGAGCEGLVTYKRSMGAHEFRVSGASTNFLVYPQKFLNPLMVLGRAMSKYNGVFSYVFNRYV